ncbi:MAG: DUF2934 domain-containing protein [Bacteroidales bacterium]|jgi:hypothetical protein
MTTQASSGVKGNSGAGKKKSKKKKIAQSDIRKRAEEIYKKRIKDGVPGNAKSDWIQAEKELLY